MALGRWLRLLSDPEAVHLPLAKRWALVTTAEILVLIGAAICFSLIGLVRGGPPSGNFIVSWLAGALGAGLIIQTARLGLISYRRRKQPAEDTEREQAE